MADEQKKGMGILKEVDDFVRTVANGATFGLADNFAGKMDSAIKGGSYDENVRYQACLSDRAITNSPVFGSIAMTTGALLTGVATGGLILPEVLGSEVLGRAAIGAAVLGADTISLVNGGLNFAPCQTPQIKSVTGKSSVRD